MSMDPDELELLRKWRSGAYAAGFRPCASSSSSLSSSSPPEACRSPTAPMRAIPGDPIDVDDRDRILCAGPSNRSCRRVYYDGSLRELPTGGSFHLPSEHGRILYDNVAYVGNHRK